MIKRIVAGAAAAGLALSLMGAAQSAQAACTASSPTHSGKEAATLPDGGKVYVSQSGTGGYAGADGSHGFIEATGSTSGGHISGNSKDAPAVFGYIGGNTGTAPTICVAGKP